MSAHYDTAAPYTASWIIFEQNGKIAFVLRQNTGWMDGYYSLPAGKVEIGESFTGCAVREAKEEVGVNIDSSDIEPVLIVQRHSEDSDWIDAFFKVKTWQGELRNAEPDVHGELVWFDPRDLPENIVPNARFSLQQIEQGVRYAEYGYAPISL